MAGPDGRKSAGMALGGVLAAGSLVLLWLACAVPSGRLGLTAAAGLFPLAASLYAGRAAGYLCWAAASLLGLFLLPDKGIALLFLAFLGLYPVTKGRIESLRRPGLEWGLKLSWFVLTLSLFWFVLRELFLAQALSETAGGVPLIYGAGSLIFAAYDLGLSQLISRLQNRLGRRKRY